jgi:hypothetical protein
MLRNLALLLGDVDDDFALLLLRLDLDLLL